MSTNYTPNYQLSQWERSDKVLMDDFNADNAKLDAALKAEADTRAEETAALAALVARKGNCRIWSTTYTGTGAYGADAPNRIAFPAQPLLAVVASLSGGACMPLCYGVAKGWAHAGGASYYCDVSWSGNSVSLVGIQHAGMNLNESGKTYLVLALIAVD